MSLKKYVILFGMFFCLIVFSYKTYSKYNYSYKFTAFSIYNSDNIVENITSNTSNTNN